MKLRTTEVYEDRSLQRWRLVLAGIVSTGLFLAVRGETENVLLRGLSGAAEDGVLVLLASVALAHLLMDGYRVVNATPLWSLSDATLVLAGRFPWSAVREIELHTVRAVMIEEGRPMRVWWVRHWNKRSDQRGLRILLTTGTVWLTRTYPLTVEEARNEIVARISDPSGQAD